MNSANVYTMLLLFAMLGAITSGQSSQDSINEFDLQELDAYNTMVSCVANFKHQFVQCNNHIKDLAGLVFKVIPENSTIGGIIKCCGIWMVRDCWLRHATGHCSLDHTAKVAQLPFKLLPKLDRWCRVYHDRTVTCSLPHHAPLIGGTMALLVTLLLLVLIAVLLREKRQRRRSSTASLEPSRRTKLEPSNEHVNASLIGTDANTFDDNNNNLNNI